MKLNRRTLLKRLGAAVVAAPIAAVAATRPAEAAADFQAMSHDLAEAFSEGLERGYQRGYDVATARAESRAFSHDLYEMAASIKRGCNVDGCDLEGEFILESLAYRFVHWQRKYPYTSSRSIEIEDTGPDGASELWEWVAQVHTGRITPRLLAVESSICPGTQYEVEWVSADRTVARVAHTTCDHAVLLTSWSTTLNALHYDPRGHIAGAETIALADGGIHEGTSIPILAGDRLWGWRRNGVGDFTVHGHEPIDIKPNSIVPLWGTLEPVKRTA